MDISAEMCDIVLQDIGFKVTDKTDNSTQYYLNDHIFTASAPLDGIQVILYQSGEIFMDFDHLYDFDIKDLINTHYSKNQRRFKLGQLLNQ